MRISTFMLSLAALVLANTAHAGGDLVIVSADLTKAYFEKNRTCELAVGTVVTDKTWVSKLRAMAKGTGRPDPGERIIAKEVMCVKNWTAGSGVYERVGCGFIWVNPETGKVDPDTPAVVAKKKCEDGGFDELLKVKVGLINKTTISDFLTKNPKDGVKELFHASGDPYRKFWDDRKVKVAH